MIDEYNAKFRGGGRRKSPKWKILGVDRGLDCIN